MDTNKKRENRAKRHKKVRAKVKGTSERPRISVYRSNKYIYAQVIDDSTNKTLISSSNIIKKESPKTPGRTTAGQAKAVKKSDAATAVGENLAKKMKNKGIKKVIFDRGGFSYHGRIKALAEGLKKGGIKI